MLTSGHSNIELIGDQWPTTRQGDNHELKIQTLERKFQELEAQVRIQNQEKELRIRDLEFQVQKLEDKI